jgi:hypothetical protein
MALIGEIKGAFGEINSTWILSPSFSALKTNDLKLGAGQAS